MQAQEFLDKYPAAEAAELMGEMARMGLEAWMDWERRSITWFFKDGGTLTIDKNGKVKSRKGTK